MEFLGALSLKWLGHKDAVQEQDGSFFARDSWCRRDNMPLNAVLNGGMRLAGGNVVHKQTTI